MNRHSLLQDVITVPCHERPFVCDGFPSDSTMVVIGENSATPLPVDWWSHWDRNAGFDYVGFVEDYLVERAALGKGTSNTRRRLDRIREAGIRCVETNTFRNEKLDGAGAGVPNYDVLNVLITNMPNLKAVLAHGQVAIEFLRGAEIPKDVRRYETRHFRSEAYSVIDAICEEVARDA